MRVLAIDDNPDNLMTLKAVISDGLPEAHLLTASSGVKGLELARARDPDVILLDIVMPGMDGYAVCRELKEDALLQSIPVLFLTAIKTDRDSRIKALEVGAEGFLSKPFDEVELIAQIRAMVKIKAAALMQRDDNERLTRLVIQRTRSLQQSQMAMLNLLEDLKRENEARRKSEEAVRDSEEKFSKAFQTSPYAITITHAEDGRFVEVNDAFTVMSGFTRAEALANTSLGLKMWVSEEDRLSTLDALRGGHAVNGKECQFQAKDGRSLTCLLFAQMIHLGQVPCILSSINDISERKRAEEEKVELESQLLQAQKMESVGRLAGGVAHDFNNMLGVILGNIELALEQAVSAPSLYENLTEVRKAAERSADLTKQLLAFARKQTVIPKVLNLNETVEGTLRMLKRLIGEDIDLVWHPQEDLWPIRVDPNQIDQILTNLCVNARDAISDGGSITIETCNCTLDEQDVSSRVGFRSGDFVQLTVRDDGKGMDGDTLAHIFEPFFTTKGVGKGTGLGLATVYGIVQQNGGLIDVFSELGQGTTFKIWLPQHVEKGEQRIEKSTPNTARRGHETILLVEDERSMLKLIQRVLEQYGYRVLAAGTPSEAIRLAREHAGQMDLLMTDVVMPDMNGRELAKNLLSLYPNLKRLFMSGYTADVIAHHGVLDEGVHFLQKPISLQDLVVKVREVLDGS